MRASEADDAELLWALRGGGGNFGVVTALEFQLHPVGPVVYGGLALYDPAHGRALARAFRDFHAGGGPEQAGLAFGYLTAPPEDFVPEEWHGKLVAAVAGMWNGPVEEGERALQPLREAVESIADLYGEIPYAELQSMIDDPPDKRNWWTAEYLDDLPTTPSTRSSPIPSSCCSAIRRCCCCRGEARSRGARTRRWPSGAPPTCPPVCVWDGRSETRSTSPGAAPGGMLARWKSGGVSSTSSATRATTGSVPPTARVRAPAAG